MLCEFTDSLDGTLHEEVSGSLHFLKHPRRLRWYFSDLARGDCKSTFLSISEIALGIGLGHWFCKASWRTHSFLTDLIWWGISVNRTCPAFLFALLAVRFRQLLC